jgi:hypothetical protein
LSDLGFYVPGMEAVACNFSLTRLIRPKTIELEKQLGGETHTAVSMGEWYRLLSKVDVSFHLPQLPEAVLDFRQIPVFVFDYDVKLKQLPSGLFFLYCAEFEMIIAPYREV